MAGERTNITDKPNDPRHGTANGYRNLGCRRDDCGCREAHRAYMVPANLAYRARKRAAREAAQ